MTIVLNEHEWAEDMISSRSLGSKPFETLYRVARYYIDSGLSKSETRKVLDSFLIQCDPTASIPKWSDTLDAAMQRALKYDAVMIEKVTVTKAEMAKIDALDGKQLRRLAFTLLCLSKYWDSVSQHPAHWVNNEDKDIMRMANINTSIKRQSLMYNTLYRCGMIRFSKKVDNTNVQVLFAEDGDDALEISDFRNLGYQYMMYHGEPYFKCANCGITTKAETDRAGRPQKYCRSCAAEIMVKNHVNAVMRYNRRVRTH